MDALILIEEGYYAILGKSGACIDTQVYLSSAELAVMCALVGWIITKDEYIGHIKAVNAKAADVYRYMNIDQIPGVEDVAVAVRMKFGFRPFLVVDRNRLKSQPDNAPQEFSNRKYD